MSSPSHRAPTWHDWRQAIAQQMTIAKTVGDESGHPQDEDIHRLRAALKVARALLRLAPPSMRDEADQHRKTLQDIARGLARIRDRYVLGETLLALTAQTNHHPKSDLKQNAITALTHAKMRLEATDSLIHTLSEPTESSDVLWQRAERFKRRMKKRMPRDWKTATIAELHAFRSALIAYSCQARFLRCFLQKPKKTTLKKLDRLRLYLGEINDLERLVETSKQGRAFGIYDLNLTVILRAQKRQKELRKKLNQRA